MTLEQLYRNYSVNDHKAKQLFFQTDWYSRIAIFDPRSEEALPQTLTRVLKKISELKSPHSQSESILHDRLWRITNHARPSLEKLFYELNESPSREHAIMPLHQVRELDTSSFMALSRRSGRNIREKLADKPYLQAVRHFQSVDIPENRLLKAFAERLEELLEIRTKYLKEEPDELLDLINSWLLSDEGKSIGRWENLPPNNTLLTHRDYRAIYDAWCWLQSLDDDLTKDFENLEKRQEILNRWEEFGEKYASCRYYFAEMPVFFDYEEFEIFPWTNCFTFEKSTLPIHHPIVPMPIREPVCIDLSEVYPSYAFRDNNAIKKATFSTPFLWQRWNESEPSKFVDIDLFSADSAYIGSNVITISGPDLLFSTRYTKDQLDCVARTFFTKLREIFVNDTLIWLLPDYLNDFEMEITRRNINARFPQAEPLPRSIAAVFEKVDYRRVSEGYYVVVVDNIGHAKCATKLEARFDPELKKRVPETHGFYWERHPPVILSRESVGTADEDGKEELKRYEIATFDEQRKWSAAKSLPSSEFINPRILHNDDRIGYFNFLINLSESPVRGGADLNILQKRAGDIPLWRDQIPELSINVLANGRYQRIHLVSRGTTIKPIRGQSIQIPVDDIFTLPAGKDYYQFPLFIGEDEEEVGFSAKLKSPLFPLKQELRCYLKMTFTYGEDDPYRLVFEPIDQTIPPIPARWERGSEDEITDAPGPEYPDALSWSELQAFPASDNSEENDLLEWVQKAINQLNSYLDLSTPDREIGEITSYWHTDKRGFHFTFADCNDMSVFIHEKSFVNETSYEDFDKGDSISFELQERDGKYSGWKIADPEYEEEKTFDDYKIAHIRKHIHKGLYFPIIQIWRDGRSITDGECPLEFESSMSEAINTLNDLLSDEDIPFTIKNEIFPLLAFMHKDAPENCIEELIERSKQENILDKRTIGFALGDLSEHWQQEIFDNLVHTLGNDVLRIFSHAIWREEHFVEKFTLDQCKAISDNLLAMLKKIKPCPSYDNSSNWKSFKWGRSTVEPLELLLGLLRTRSSSNKEIRMLLQPHQKITMEFAREVERVTGLVAESGITVISRVQLDNLPAKPDGDNTPDLLYALRLYLTGDDGANAIQITGVSDTVNE